MLAAALASLLGSVALVAVSIPILRRVEILDVPNARSSHVAVVPRGGGLGLLLAVLLGVLLGFGTVGLDWWLAAVLMLPSLGLAVVGLVDDVRSTSPRVRAGAQLAMGVVLSLCLSLTRLTWAPPGVAAVICLVGAIWVVAFVNAFNFMDGVNAISGLSAALAGAWYATLARSHHQQTLELLGWSIAAAAVGFLVWNGLRAKVFLGDVGSYGVGALLAGMALASFTLGFGLLSSLAPLSAYLVDTLVTLVDRARRGERLTEAHRDHVYQRLVRGGFSHQASALTNVGTAALVCVADRVLPTLAAVCVAGVLLITYLALPTAIAKGGVST